MKTQVQTTLLTIGLLLSFTAANAQFDLNKLKDKVKGKVETRVSDKVLTKRDQVKAEQTAKIKDRIPKPDEVIGNIGKYDYKKKYKPSAAALAEDPKAADKTVPPKYNKSIGEIHAAYEHLDPVAFPYQPYYKYKDFYVMHDEAGEKKMYENFMLTVLNLAIQPAGQPNYIPYTAIQNAAGEKVMVTNDEFFRNAWTALYVADPTSALAFHNYVNVVMFENRGFEILYQYKFSDAQKGVVDAKTGALLFAPSESIYTSAQDDRKAIALNLARTVMPMDYLRYYVNGLYDQYNAEANPTLKFVLSYKIDGIMENIFTKHKDYNSANAENRKILGFHSIIKDQRFEVEQSVRADFAPTVEMPKGVSIDGATSAKVNALAKEMHGENFVKTIFLGNKWKEFKENKYPYRVMHLSIPVAVITKKSNKYFINYYDVAKSPHGGDWNMMVQMGAGTKPVNYK